MVRKSKENPSHVLSIILAGGAGKRLFPLTQDRSKPAVPLGGKYRLIDVPISNCLNSGLKKIFVLTQFNSASLNRHISNTYRFDPFAEGFIEVLAAEQTLSNSRWFQGTADAVRQHLHQFTGRENDYQLILSGDQLYRMDYHKLLDTHWKRGADVTLCVIPKSEAWASSFGLLKLAADGRVEQFREKPKGDALHEMKTDTAALGLNPDEAAKRPYLASMGIYLFKRDVLTDLLADASMIDFGYQVIPRAIEKLDVYGYLFDDYWEDLGTVEAFYRANMDLTGSDPHFDFHDMTAPIYTRARFLPSSRIERCEIRESIIAEGSVLLGARIFNSVVGIRSQIGEEVALDKEGQQMALARAYLGRHDHLDAAVAPGGQLAQLVCPAHVVVVGDGDQVQVGLLLHIVQDLRNAVQAVAIGGVDVQVGLAVAGRARLRPRRHERQPLTN